VLPISLALAVADLKNITVTECWMVTFAKMKLKRRDNNINKKSTLEYGEKTIKFDILHLVGAF
jgi:hypothetical protein